MSALHSLRVGVVIAASSVLALAASAPASAGGVTSPAARLSAAAGEVLFWQSLNDPADGFSIVKGSVANPTPFATVLTRAPEPAPYASFSGPEVSPDGSKLAYIKVSVAATCRRHGPSRSAISRPAARPCWPGRPRP